MYLITKKIRLAILRCDTHGIWYGPLLERCDPLRFMEFSNVCHHYFTNMYRPKEWIVSFVSGFELMNVWDYDVATAKRFAHVFYDKPRVCRTIEEATEGVDAALIADCDNDGSDHLKLAAPFLKKGIATFVDKPFAATLKDAKAMCALSKKYRAPLLNASLLTYAVETELLRRRFVELEGPVRRGIIKGFGGWHTKRGLEGIIHGIALARAVFGNGVEWVEAMGTLPLEYMLLHWHNGIEAVLLNTSGECCSYGFGCDVYAKRAKGNPPYRAMLEMHAIGDREFPKAGERILKDFRQMVRTSRMPIPHEAMCEPIAIYEAGLRAQKTGKRNYVKP